jgi:hypothetical protein
MTGALPPGLQISAAGLISGTPTLRGTFTGTIQAKNSFGTGTQPFAIAIGPAPLSKFTLKVAVRPATVLCLGKIAPVPDGSTIRVSEQQRQSGAWVEIHHKNVLTTGGAYSATFVRPPAGKYRAVATFAGTPDIEAGTTSAKFAI